MKKRLLITLLLLCVALTAFGASSLPAHAEARLDYVTDGANLLSEAERAALRDRAAEISDRYGFPVYIVTVDDYTDYVNGSIEYFTEEIFRSYDLGAGETGDGVLLALSMKERDYDLYAHGDFGNYAFTDYGKEQLANTFLDNFRSGDWAGGFADYVDNCGVLLQRARDGDPVDIWIPDPTPQPEPRQPEGMTPLKMLLSLLFPGLVSGATVSGMARQMKTANRQTRAENYIGQGGVELRERQDQFINRSVTRQVIRRAPPGGGNQSGGHFGGTTISSSRGGSHHSG